MSDGIADVMGYMVDDFVDVVIGDVAEYVAEYVFGDEV